MIYCLLPERPLGARTRFVLLTAFSSGAGGLSKPLCGGDGGGIANMRLSMSNPEQVSYKKLILGLSIFTTLLL